MAQVLRRESTAHRKQHTSVSRREISKRSFIDQRQMLGALQVKFTETSIVVDTAILPS